MDGWVNISRAEMSLLWLAVAVCLLSLLPLIKIFLSRFVAKIFYEKFLPKDMKKYKKLCLIFQSLKKDLLECLLQNHHHDSSASAFLPLVVDLRKSIFDLKQRNNFFLKSIINKKELIKMHHELETIESSLKLRHESYRKHFLSNLSIDEAALLSSNEDNHEIFN